MAEPSRRGHFLLDLDFLLSCENSLGFAELWWECRCCTRDLTLLAFAKYQNCFVGANKQT